MAPIPAGPRRSTLRTCVRSARSVSRWWRAPRTANARRGRRRLLDATPAAPTAWAGGPALDLTADPDWQCYRYKTLLLTIPLKNMIFGGQT